MGDLYHLLIQTPDANLSKGMRHLNGAYTQASNHPPVGSGMGFRGASKGFWLIRMRIYWSCRAIRTGKKTSPCGNRSFDYDNTVPQTTGSKRSPLKTRVALPRSTS